MLPPQAVNRAGWFQPLGSGGSDGWARRQTNRLNTRALAVLDKVSLVITSIIIQGEQHNWYPPKLSDYKTPL